MEVVIEVIGKFNLMLEMIGNIFLIAHFGVIFSLCFVIRNISPYVDKSCSSSLNGLDPEQMSE